MQYVAFVAPVLVAYLIGSIPFGLLAGYATKGIDIRKYGSGNLGATNVARTLGIWVGLGVMVLDAAKGFLPTFFFPALAVGLLGEVPEFAEPWLSPGVAFGCIAGHVYPIYLRFKGGKGVATSLGVLLALAPNVVALGAAVFVVTVLISRYISLGSVLGALSVGIGAWLINPGEGTFPTNLFIAHVAGLVIVKHRSNISRLLKGTEAKFGQKVETGQALEEGEEQ